MSETKPFCSEAFDPEAITVWPFYEAPDALRDFSEHGGDEDWLALLPAKYADNWPLWVEMGSGFGACDTSQHILPDGRVVLIGAHA